MPKVSKIRLIPKEQLENVVSKSTRFADILKAFDLPYEGGLVSSLKRVLSEYKIDYTHISTGNNSNIGKKFGYKKPVEEYLVSNSKVSRYFIKKKLIDCNLLKNECYICHMKPEWNGHKLVMVLDHINGIHNDYRQDNLRLLCPNCNSQTDTFAGRNKKYKSCV